MDSVFIQNQITFYTSLITNIQEALLELSQNPNKSFTLNTGQTTETVTKMDMQRLHGMLEMAVTQLTFWSEYGDGGLVVQPGW